MLTNFVDDLQLTYRDHILAVYGCMASHSADNI